MRRVSVEHLKMGMKVARSVYKADGLPLIQAGIILTDAFIERLRQLEIPAVYIEDADVADIEIDDVICEETRVEAIEQLRTTINDLRAGKGLSIEIIDETKAMIGNIINELLMNREILVNLNDIRVVDDYTFGHSVNVCILSLITGISLHYNQLQLRDLGIGAILHDIGKAKISEKILKKPAPLSPDEFNEIKKHTWYGFEMLRSCKDISLLSSHIALQHHESYDGNGYPRGIERGEIMEFARIVSVADVYDALTSDRVYRNAVMPHQAVEIIQKLKGNKLDPKITNIFLRHIPIYPLGSKVELNNGQTGFVVAVNQDFITRPVVRVIDDKDGDIPKYEEIDLLNNPSTFIIRVLD